MQKQINKLLLIVTLFFMLATYFLIMYSPSKDYSRKAFRDLVAAEVDDVMLVRPDIIKKYVNGKWRLLNDNQTQNLSILGRMLYLNEQRPEMFDTKNYTILIWKHGKDFEGLYPKKHVHYKHDPLESCSVKNCFIKHQNSDLLTADIVIFNLNLIKRTYEIPIYVKRPPYQIWAFFSTESPISILNLAYSINEFDNVFNWSMTYRMDSDIPIPYGRTIFLHLDKKVSMMKYAEWNGNKRQDVLVAIVSSNCQGNNHRWSYIMHLQKYLQIDIYGNCGHLRCKSDIVNTQTRLANDCAEISRYKFYLAFEDSNCDEYLTEKVWWYGFAKNTIPIVMGGSKSCYEQLLPPDSFIHVESFAGPRHLADYIKYLNHTASDYQLHFWWKRYFKVFNEHGYFHTELVRYCRICEALNYNENRPKVYTNLSQFFSLDKCYPFWNA